MTLAQRTVPRFVSRQFIALQFIVALAVVPWAYGSERLYVTNNGVDSATCGAKETPCRSITQGITNAAAGDTIVVGPGKYGDLNGNSVLGENGEETPAIGCDCMIAVNKPVTLVSSDGAAVTNIDAATVYVVTDNVWITASPVQFGAPGYGFTVTSTRPLLPSDPDFSRGVKVIGAQDVSVRGNRFVHFRNSSSISLAVGVEGARRIENNEVIGWYVGIAGGPNSSIKQNAIHAGLRSSSGAGIVASGSVTGNIVTDYSTGIRLSGNGLAVGNAVHGNDIGFDATGGGTLQGNNIFGNLCGLQVDQSNTNPPPGRVIATGNYWGTANGPETTRNDLCGTDLGRVSLTPFATKPFTIKLPAI